MMTAFCKALLGHIAPTRCPQQLGARATVLNRLFDVSGFAAMMVVSLAVAGISTIKMCNKAALQAQGN
ncbi:hypothetical protein ACJ5NV_16780 [Loktanella agnita]|uniref:hypothetical protein n=1 Tax=Loktanella agnita TaxID=287097 RepID=UPI003988B71D